MELNIFLFFMRKDNENVKQYLFNSLFTKKFENNIFKNLDFISQLFLQFTIRMLYFQDYKKNTLTTEIILHVINRV